MFGQDLPRPADEPGRGLVAGTRDHEDVGEHLVAGQPARRPVLVLELGVEQFGHEVVGGVPGPPVDVLAEHLAVGEVSRYLHRLAGVRAEVRVHVVPDSN